MDTPLIVTRDPALEEELFRLAAAAGAVPHIVHDAASGLRGWGVAPLVLVGADLAPELSMLAPPRRSAAYVVAQGSIADDLFAAALRMGAEDVVALPRSEGWLVEVMTDLGDGGPEPALTLGVVGGSGGAGATTFACALGQVAARTGPAVVIDTDPQGPGVDRVLGLEADPGARWDALQQTTGRLSSRSFREALPRRGELRALTWSPGPQGTLQAFAVRAALSAAQRGHRTVLLDLPRTGNGLVTELVARCDQVVVVVVPTVSGVASAVRVCARLADFPRLRLVLRGAGAAADDVARVTGLPVVASMVDQRGVDEAVDLGLGPVRNRRGPLGRAAADVLAAFAR